MVSALTVGCSEQNITHQLGVERPNVLIILADDLGFSDLGIYGSEIPTPNIDSLARSGAMATRFYSNATCAPSRAMLLSGLDSHSVGYGFNPVAAQRLPVLNGKPGYSGVWPYQVNSFVEGFASAGYHTLMAGKWHQGNSPDANPHARGFKKAFYLVDGGASHFSDAAGQTSSAPIANYFEDGIQIDKLPSDFYSTQFYVNKLISYLDDKKGDANTDPFFGYLAFTAPHWPLQVPEDWQNKFSGVYDDGWEKIRAQRIESARKLGLISQTAAAPPFPDALGSWSDLSEESKARESRKMELYAAMIAYLDNEIGRLIAYLKSSGKYENTLIVFLSDNGPEGNDIEYGLADNKDWLPKNFDQSYQNMGKVNSYVTLGRGWAHVSAGILNEYKSFLGEGGVRVPAIFSFPKIIPKNLKINTLFSILDIAPTLLDIGKIPAYDREAMQGFSAVRELLDQKSKTEFRSTLSMETYGNKATWSGKWKLHWDWESRKWQLFDVQTDPGEIDDLSAVYPAKVSEMKETFSTYADANNVILLESEVGYARYQDQLESFKHLE
jgi:arylsulfatase